jgi:hypothetical protein
MGYLNNASVTVDAILTNKGRQLLATGGQLQITKFALSDDEIDYDLWNPAHTLGTNYYGKVIEDMPIIEALPDESQMMRYKLVTLPKDVIGIPSISVTPGSISFTSVAERSTVTPTTLNLAGANRTLGYTAILSDDTVAMLEVAPDGGVGSVPRTVAGVPGLTGVAGANQTAASQAAANATTSVTSFIDDEITGITTAGKTITKVGTKFIVRPVAQATDSTGRIPTKRALLTIIGNETGGFITIQITTALIIRQDIGSATALTGPNNQSA